MYTHCIVQIHIQSEFSPKTTRSLDNIQRPVRVRQIWCISRLLQVGIKNMLLNFFLHSVHCLVCQCHRTSPTSLSDAIPMDDDNSFSYFFAFICCGNRESSTPESFGKTRQELATLCLHTCEAPLVSFELDAILCGSSRFLQHFAWKFLKRDIS